MISQQKSQSRIRQKQVVMNWTETQKGIQGTLTFDSQTQLAKFVVRLATISDERQHHADMDVRYNRLHLTIFTHDENAVTHKDWNLCQSIEALIEEELAND